MLSLVSIPDSGFLILLLSAGRGRHTEPNSAGCFLEGSDFEAFLEGPSGETGYVAAHTWLRYCTQQGAATIDEYADGGGDSGVTLRCVQKYCGLDVAADNAAPVDACGSTLPNPLFDPVGNVDVEDHQIAISLAVSVLTHGTGSITLDQVQKTVAIRQHANKSFGAYSAKVHGRRATPLTWHQQRKSLQLTPSMAHLRLLHKGSNPATPELVEEMRSREFMHADLQNRTNNDNMHQENCKPLWAHARKGDSPWRSKTRTRRVPKSWRSSRGRKPWRTLQPVLEQLQHQPDEMSLPQTYCGKIDARYSRRYAKEAGVQGLSKGARAVACHAEDWDI